MVGYNFSLKPQELPKVNTANRLIQTSLPAPGTEDLIARLNKVESRSMQGQIPLVWERAEDFAV